ncbi:MAG: prenyltransferase [Coriobacteriia bacterium]|nr:prenyltransferase [Coriobacteriia bacterium]
MSQPESQAENRLASQAAGRGTSEAATGQPVHQPVESSKSLYRPFTVKAAIELASPQTWSAAISPVLVGGAAAWALTALEPFKLDTRALVCWLLMLACALLAQSAVNTLNDYKDFLSGTDTVDTILDKTDASIVYNSINPKAALRFGIVLCLLALLVGAVVTVLSSWWLIVLGAAGAAAVIFYSFGPKPLSFLPLGELVSGLAMGGIITVATYIAMTRAFSPLILLVAFPAVLTIALIMLTNNTCDIGRDIIAGRKTLAVKLGFERSRRLAGVVAVITMLWMAVLSLMLWLFALLPVAIGVFIGHKRIAMIMRGSYDLHSRRQMMANISSWCLLVNSCWAAGLLLTGLVGAWLL